MAVMAEAETAEVTVEVTAAAAQARTLSAQPRRMSLCLLHTVALQYFLRRDNTCR